MISPKVARVVVILIASLNLFLGFVYLVLGLATFLFTIFGTEVWHRPESEFAHFNLFSALIVLYALFLLAGGYGLLRERPWGWMFGLIAGGISVLWSGVDVARGNWGLVLFDVVYGGLLIGSLLVLRRAGRPT